MIGKSMSIITLVATMLKRLLKDYAILVVLIILLMTLVGTWLLTS